MKIVHEEILFGGELLTNRADLGKRLDEIRRAIRNVVWPAGSRTFTIRPVIDGNGVLPIKIGFMDRLRRYGWALESRPVLAEGLGPGKIDAICKTPSGQQIAAEWETGNISSSHRALNKMCVGILQHHLTGGVLILPDRELYNFLTQRIGNYKELAPYFPVYRNLAIHDGFLIVMAVSHDRSSAEAPLIPKGSDGNALLRASRIQ